MADKIDKSIALIQKYQHPDQPLAEIIRKNRAALEKTVRCLTVSAARCGCISLSDSKAARLCADCREQAGQSIGDSFFQLLALCTALRLDVAEILEKEARQTKLLGRFNLK